MNEKHMSKTQLKLINTAGPLFAKDGLKGTRIRYITEKAGVNVAGINYHFGSKEKLYFAVIDYVFEKLNYTNLGKHWERLPKSEHTRSGIFKMLRYCLKDNFTRMFTGDHPLWYFKIVNHILIAPESDYYKEIDKHIYESDLAAINAMLKILSPEVHAWDAEAWLAIWYGQTIGITTLMPKNVVFYDNNNKLITDYIDAVCENIYIAVTTLLEKHLINSNK